MNVITPYSPSDATAITLEKGEAFTFVENGGRVRYMLRVSDGSPVMLAVDIEDGQIWDIDPLLEIKRCPRAVLLAEQPKPEGKINPDAPGARPRKAKFRQLKAGAVFRLDKPEAGRFGKEIYIAARCRDGGKKAVSLDAGSCLSLIGDAGVIEYPEPFFYPFGMNI